MNIINLCYNVLKLKWPNKYFNLIRCKRIKVICSRESIPRRHSNDRFEMNRLLRDSMALSSLLFLHSGISQWSPLFPPPPLQSCTRYSCYVHAQESSRIIELCDEDMIQSIRTVSVPFFPLSRCFAAGLPDWKYRFFNPVTYKNHIIVIRH